MSVRFVFRIILIFPSTGRFSALTSSCYFYGRTPFTFSVNDVHPNTNDFRTLSNHTGFLRHVYETSGKPVFLDDSPPVVFAIVPTRPPPPPSCRFHDVVSSSGRDADRHDGDDRPRRLLAPRRLDVTQRHVTILLLCRKHCNITRGAERSAHHAYGRYIRDRAGRRVFPEWVSECAHAG